MIRKALADDVPALDAFLLRHLESSMFPLHNLRSHGLGGDHARALDILWWPDARGQVAGLLGVTREGMVMPQAPNGADWPALVQRLSGRALKGCLGQSDQVSAFIAAAGLEYRATAIAAPEPLMRRDLDANIARDTPGDLRPIAEMPRDIAVAWRATYNVDLLGADPDKAEASATRDIEHYIQADSHRALFVDGAPRAVTGFNARVADMVQIGGVYTPPEYRRRGFAGFALRHHLAEAHQTGARRAVLFAASDTAMGVYARVGFTHIGSYTLHIFKAPETCP